MQIPKGLQGQDSQESFEGLRSLLAKIKSKKQFLTVWQTNRQSTGKVHEAMISAFDEDSLDLILAPVPTTGPFELVKADLVYVCSPSNGFVGKFTLVDADPQRPKLKCLGIKDLKKTERRRDLRFKSHNGPVKVVFEIAGSTLDFEMFDISATGLSFKVLVPLPMRVGQNEALADFRKGREVMLVRLGKKYFPSNFSAKVVSVAALKSAEYSRDETYAYFRIGLKFHIPLEQQKFLSFVEALL